MNDKVKQTLQAVLDKFKSGDIPEVVAYAMYPIADVPSSKWSLMNRIIIMLAETRDARGYRQWQQANRFVKKGAKALYILVPFMKKTEDGDGKETTVLKGFGCRPVFKVEDTDGEPLDYQEIELPEFPLIERAEQWGISVQAVPGNYHFFGCYSGKRQEIELATQEECIFFHELAHAAHAKIIGSLKPGQNPLQEIVAEMSSQCLCRLVGKSGERYLGNAYRYIERYAEQIQMSPHMACLKAMSETEKVLNLILAKNDPTPMEMQAEKTIAA
jgi:hypothetical protein